VSVLAPAAAASGASVALRRAHAAALTQLGFVQTRQRRFGTGLAALEAALAIWRGIDPLLADSDAAANFGIATVSGSGVVTGKRSGVVTITAQTSGVSGSVTIDVN